MLADHVYDELLGSLVDGKYPPGSPLSIDGLSRELDVSQTPIREALARLESTGLVRRTALKGYRVAPLFTTADLADLTEARMVIEPVNAFRACERVTDGFVDQLRQTIADLASSPTGPSFTEFRAYWAADERFHQLIAEHADNAFLLSAYEALGGQIQRFRLFAGLGVTDAEHAIAEHSAILDAFAAGDSEGAREAMKRHIGGVKGRSLNESIDRET